MNLIQLRNSKNLTQKQLANLINVTQTAISKFEKNIAIPKFHTMQKLADALEVDLQTIVECFIKKEDL